MRIGVLALQGAVREHLTALSQLGHVGVEVRLPEHLSELEGIILPGGESTAMRRLLDKAYLVEPLRAFVASRPALGTCAGAILLSKRIEPLSEPAILGSLDITVHRNAYGSQLSSFVEPGTVAGIDDFPMVFIRAPRFSELGAEVEPIARCRGQIVGVRCGHIWALAFHPELAGDWRVHAAWLAQP